MKKLYISHLHGSIYENGTNKYHINAGKASICICGHTNPNYSSNGDAITLEWYKANIANDVDGQVCKKCAKKALFILESKADIVQYNALEAQKEIQRRLRAIEKIEDKLFDESNYSDKYGVTL